MAPSVGPTTMVAITAAKHGMAKMDMGSGQKPDARWSRLATPHISDVRRGHCARPTSGAYAAASLRSRDAISPTVGTAERSAPASFPAVLLWCLCPRCVKSALTGLLTLGVHSANSRRSTIIINHRTSAVMPSITVQRGSGGNHVGFVVVTEDPENVGHWFETPKARAVDEALANGVLIR